MSSLYQVFILFGGENEKEPELSGYFAQKNIFFSSHTLNFKYVAVQLQSAFSVVPLPI